MTYTGAQALTIEGKDAVIDGAERGWAGVRRQRRRRPQDRTLTFQNSPAEGIDVEVPAAATGTLKVSLYQVTIKDNKGHGVLVNDQVRPVDHRWCAAG